VLLISLVYSDTYYHAYFFWVFILLTMNTAYVVVLYLNLFPKFLKNNRVLSTYFTSL
jgi:hypothetical protein